MNFGLATPFSQSSEQLRGSDDGTGSDSMTPPVPRSRLQMPSRRSTLLGSIFLDDAFDSLLPMQPSVDKYVPSESVLEPHCWPPWMDSFNPKPMQRGS
jgi:hypothetical protein